MKKIVNRKKSSLWFKSLRNQICEELEKLKGFIHLNHLNFKELVGKGTKVSEIGWRRNELNKG